MIEKTNVIFEIIMRDADTGRQCFHKEGKTLWVQIDTDNRGHTRITMEHADLEPKPVPRPPLVIGKHKKPTLPRFDMKMRGKNRFPS